MAYYPQVHIIRQNMSCKTEPPYTEPYVRWCERSVRELISHLLLDLAPKSGLNFSFFQTASISRRRFLIEILDDGKTVGVMVVF